MRTKKRAAQSFAWLSSALILILTLACGGGDVGDSACIPGTTLDCKCAAAEFGVQSCNVEGSGYDACDCTGSQPPDEDTHSPIPDVDAATPPIDGEQCFTKHAKQCVGSDLFWFDSCGNQEALLESCAGGCADGKCVEGCVPKNSIQCVGDQPHFFDSCGNDGGIVGAQACGEDEFCKDDPNGAFCIKAVYDGDWKMTADPDIKECGVATTQYPPQVLQLTMDGLNATATISVGGTTVHYTGSIDEKTLSLTGNWTQAPPFPTEHDELIEVTFDSASTFSGLHQDAQSTLTSLLQSCTIDADCFIGKCFNGTCQTESACTVIWNITGVKN